MTTHQDESRTERELRAALDERAREVRPSSRLDAILVEAAGPDHDTGSRRWWTVAAVAATAALVGGVVWAARPDGDGGTLPATPPPTTSAPSPSASASASASPSPTVSSSPSPSSATTAPGPSAPTTTSAALAIYRVGTNGGEAKRPGLVREFWTASVGPSETARVKRAVDEALRRTDLWSGVSATGIHVTQTAITLRLSGPGADAPSAESARLAAYALVWSAQGAVGRGDLPVSIGPEGGGKLLGHLDPSTPFTRAATPPEALCDIWVDSPSPGASVRAAQPVVVRGQAVAFEATLEWDLRRGADVVKDGFTTASIGAPSRGTFSVDLGRLAAGSYTFRAFTTSAEDGSVFAERTVTFTVR